MKIGDLVKFWDYEGGNGHVTGLVVDMLEHKYCHDKEPIASVGVLYEDHIQLIPLEDEWLEETSDEGR